ncbi:phosphotransferase family protein [Streptomyces varsoviensis]|uniref:Aminoglycoside phosphotransferase n=1 Tax=Streptomyces varsoviensis TaxID=67373 RepID=A0ABR5J9C5_9ACTN|nr:aminoglycoside phosphotransferase family protein [Streptomyces varsoviensis]KOG89961.1 aminoglycoside phosphotransferase [Streptomyces varsoviensis]
MRARLVFGDVLRAELEAGLGVPKRSRRLESSPRSRVWRVELSRPPGESEAREMSGASGTSRASGASRTLGTPGASRGSVVVKQLVEGPGADERYAREVAALRLASRAEAPVAPALLATDAGERMLVLEDLAHQRPPEDWIVGYATALARLHATARPEDAGALPRWQGPSQADADAFLALAETLKAPVPPGASGELHDLVSRLGQAPGHTALLHGDPCPGNDLHTAAGIKFIDFEQASLGNGLMELAYLHVGFPTCWCVTSAPAPLLRRAEHAYRTAWRAATGSEPEGDLADACAGWLLRGDALVERAHRDGTDHLARLPHQDWAWGTATARQRLAHRLAVVSRLTTAHPALSRTSALTATMRRHLLTRWPALQPVPTRRP